MLNAAGMPKLKAPARRRCHVNLKTIRALITVDEGEQLPGLRFCSYFPESSSKVINKV
jgi:hypothetical protein